MSHFINRSSSLPCAIILALTATLISLAAPFPPNAHAKEGGETVLYVEPSRDVAKQSDPIKQGPAAPDLRGGSVGSPDTADASLSPLACVVIGTCAVVAGMSAKMRVLVRRNLTYDAPDLRRLLRIL